MHVQHILYLNHQLQEKMYMNISGSGFKLFLCHYCQILKSENQCYTHLFTSCILSSQGNSTIKNTLNCCYHFPLFFLLNYHRYTMS